MECRLQAIHLGVWYGVEADYGRGNRNALQPASGCQTSFAIGLGAVHNRAAGVISDSEEGEIHV
jgi:hypothetical protein